jgi:fructose-1,6-bisphosphatase/inositol monophosphatase family enzyme
VSDPSDLLEPIRRLHAGIRDAVVAACEDAALEDLARVSREGAGDTVYAVDRVSEERIVEFFAREVAPRAPLVLVAEGLEGAMVLPKGAPEAKAEWRVIVDPLDGSRGLMYQKRSAWILTGVARNRGAATTLEDVVLAVQTEVPVVKQHLSDVLWAAPGRGAHAERYDRLTGRSHPVRLRPSGADSIAHGFATITRFFPGAREELAAIDEEMVKGALGPVRRGEAQCFEDQYISTAGQLYELMAGHDRFVADLRPLLERSLEARGLHLGICCHPYDLCTELVARELGVVVTDPAGGPLRAPLDAESDVAWVGYANPAIRAQIEPLLQAALRRRRLLA